MRDFILNNLRLKLTALLLALLVWFVIKFAIYNRTAGGHNQIVTRQAVLVLKRPDDNRVYRVQPPRVDLILRATKEVSQENLEVFVNVTGLSETDMAFKPVLVRSTDGTKILSVETDPPKVMVERVTSNELFLTNTLSKP